MRSRLLFIPLLIAAGCAPRQIHEDPVLRTGDRVTTDPAAMEAVRTDAQRTQRDATTRRNTIAADALANCAPKVCEAIARGELAIGMTEPQVLAATRTTEAAWTSRDAANASVLVPVSLSAAPRDVMGEVAMVQLRDGRVAAYSYSEAAGVRVVTSAEQATTDGRASAMADMMLREGDDYTARGDLNAALDRYDRAQVLRPSDPRIDYRIATVLDKALRPIEAQVRYQLFLHKLELEKIDAYGKAYGNMADAIAQARQRVIVLEKQNR
ncbi:MAG: hypothetical protein ABIV28_07410 [Longimicrobiales bacterium]